MLLTSLIKIEKLNDIVGVGGGRREGRGEMG